MMEPQDWCCVCGEAKGAPYKTAIVEGKRVTYPELIEFHHVNGRKNPEGVYLCRECHGKHHTRSPRLEFDDPCGVWVWRKAGAAGWKPCRTATGLESA